MFVLRVDEGDHDVAGTFGDLQPLVVVREAAGVHQQPAAARVAHRTVVSDEATSTPLVVRI